MALMKRSCTECGHATQQIVGCGRIDCQAGSAAIHDHCIHDGPQEPDGNLDYEHSLCTPRGCRATTTVAPLVNPDIVTGEVPAAREVDSLGRPVTGLDG